MPSDLKPPLLAGIALLSLIGCSLPRRAPEALAAAPSSERITRNLATVGAYYAAAEALDLDAFADLWAANGEFVVPWLPALRLAGKDAIRDGFAKRLAGISKISQTHDLSPLANGDQVFARAEMTFQYTNGLVYSNTLVALFTLDEDGKIVKMEEWIDLETFRRTFGALPGR